ncbi:hypothetical protein BKA63DRAFT_594847 [Paraphoma chrysanthemicola]|nr:hypothetical protein BKA63DRAFT_594847 [Paraphoma chrysanthemicola]
MRTSVELLRKEVVSGQHMLRYFQDEDEHRELQPEFMVAPLRIKYKGQSDRPQGTEMKLDNASVDSNRDLSDASSMDVSFHRYGAKTPKDQHSLDASSMVVDSQSCSNVPIGFDTTEEQIGTLGLHSQEGNVNSCCQAPSAPSLYGPAHFPGVVDWDTVALVDGLQDHETVASIPRSPLRVRNIVDTTAADIRTSTTIDNEVFGFVHLTLPPPPSTPPNQRDSTLSYAQHDYGTLAAMLPNRSSTPDTFSGSQGSSRPKFMRSMSTIFDPNRAVHPLPDSRSIAALQRGIAWFEEHLPIRSGSISARVPGWSARVKAGFREGLGEVEEFLGGLL